MERWYSKIESQNVSIEKDDNKESVHGRQQSPERKEGEKSNRNSQRSASNSNHVSQFDITPHQIFVQRFNKIKQASH